jgi:hypothetical protein
MRANRLLGTPLVQDERKPIMSVLMQALRDLLSLDGWSCEIVLKACDNGCRSPFKVHAMTGFMSGHNPRDRMVPT